MKELFEADPDACPAEDRAAAKLRFLALSLQGKSRLAKKAEVSGRADKLLAKLRKQKQEIYLDAQLDALIRQLDGALLSEGVHRKAGAAEVTRPLKQMMDKAEQVIPDAKAPDCEHATVDLLKHLFTLPYRDGEALIPARLTADFARQGLEAEELASWLISSLPEANKNAFLKILDHLARVARHAETNLMDATNLAIVYGTKLVDPKLNGLALVAVSARAKAVMENLIRRQMAGKLQA